MSKYKLILDESGSFSNNNEKYIILGGLLFNVQKEKQLDEKFRPIHTNMCKTFSVKELHGVENKKYFSYLCVAIGSEENFLPVVIVIDKQKTYIFDTYDKISYKYNKAIEHLVNHLLEDNYIKKNDELYIRIDNINLSSKETKNLSEYLPKMIKCVKKVEQGDSKKYICLQFADVIVNRFSKKRNISRQDKEMVLLHPQIYTFLEETIDEYVK